MTTTVAARELRLQYRDNLALAGISFDLTPGVTGLLGPNGAGKTTLLSILATALPPDSGELSVLGHDPAQTGGRREIRRRLGFMPQDPGFYPRFTLADFIDHVAILKEITPRAARRSETARVLELVDLADRARHRMKTLSGGMLQRAALAAALVGDPSVLVLDEPMVGLDPEQRLRLRELVADLGESRTVVLSTHQTEDVMSLCRRVVVIRKGHAVFEGTPAELARQAEGRVWISDTRPVGALAAWRTGTDQYRCIGDPPTGARLESPALEDGYLILIGEATEAAAEVKA